VPRAAASLSTRSLWDSGGYSQMCANETKSNPKITNRPQFPVRRWTSDPRL